MFPFVQRTTITLRKSTEVIKRVQAPPAGSDMDWLMLPGPHACTDLHSARFKDAHIPAENAQTSVQDWSGSESVDTCSQSVCVAVWWSERFDLFCTEAAPDETLWCGMHRIHKGNKVSGSFTFRSETSDSPSEYRVLNLSLYHGWDLILSYANGRFANVGVELFLYTKV